MIGRIPATGDVISGPVGVGRGPDCGLSSPCSLLCQWPAVQSRARKTEPVPPLSPPSAAQSPSGN